VSVGECVCVCVCVLQNADVCACSVNANMKCKRGVTLKAVTSCGSDKEGKMLARAFVHLYEHRAFIQAKLN